LHLQFNLLRATCNSLVRFIYCCNYLDDRFFWQFWSVGDHAFAYWLTNKKYCLYCSKSLSNHDKTHFSFRSWIVNSSADSYHLTWMTITQIFYSNINLSKTIFWITLRLNHLDIPKFISRGIIRVFCKLIRLCGTLSLSCS